MMHIQCVNDWLKLPKNQSKFVNIQQKFHEFHVNNPIPVSNNSEVQIQQSGCVIYTNNIKKEIGPRYIINSNETPNQPHVSLSSYVIFK